ncbi:MAG TPA: hypothetical protein VI386_19415 [Candidatus Sulfotelmatobacter sp.]
MHYVLIVPSIEHPEMVEVDIGFGAQRRFRSEVVRYLQSNGFGRWARLVNAGAELDEQISNEQFARLRREFQEAA